MHPFKKGDIVKCADASFLSLLTLGKDYVVKGVANNQLCIISNNGSVCYFFADRFVLSENQSASLQEPTSIDSIKIAAERFFAAWKSADTATKDHILSGLSKLGYKIETIVTHQLTKTKE